MKKRTKRKIWSTEINPIAHAIAGACVTDEPSLNKLRLVELAAVDSMARGAGNIEDWRCLADMVNICETMADSGIGPEASPYCTALQEDLIEAAHRFEKTGRMGLTGKGLVAAKEVYAYHDIQRASIARSAYERMIEKTRNRIKSNHDKVVTIK